MFDLKLARLKQNIYFVDILHDTVDILAYFAKIQDKRLKASYRDAFNWTNRSNVRIAVCNIYIYKCMYVMYVCPCMYVERTTAL